MLSPEFPTEVKVVHRIVAILAKIHWFKKTNAIPGEECAAVPVVWLAGDDQKSRDRPTCQFRPAAGS